jgi:ribosome biogenesis GTPase / thiamine phosphate phosphatase
MEMTEDLTLRALGWSPAFQAQLDLDEMGRLEPMRVAVVHRGAVELIGPGGARRAATGGEAAAVGDWVLVDPASGRLVRILERKSLLQRRAAGTGREAQPIAANLDTLFVVTACNADFNPARIERYLVLARQAGVLPVVVLTRADDCGDPGAYAARVWAVAPGLAVEALDARDPAQAARLGGWCGPGETAGLVGSSGVGKSTLVNALTGAGQVTRGIREDDARGRHTTTARSLHRLASGGWLIDTPGMRALRLHDAAEGVEAVFADITGLAQGCRFADCAHEGEPGCAVQAAIAAGALDPARLARWRKLAREEARNSASLAERRRQVRATGRLHRSIQAEKRGRRDG